MTPAAVGEEDEGDAVAMEELERSCCAGKGFGGTEEDTIYVECEGEIRWLKRYGLRVGSVVAEVLYRVR